MKRGNSVKKGLILGALGSAAGLLGMRLYWQWLAPQVRGRAPEELNRLPEGETADQLKDISLIGRQYRDDESATAAAGRILYEKVTGAEPPDLETRTRLSYWVHWSYGIMQGALYGALRRNATWPDLVGGLVYATGLWLIGDELAAPVLGLQDGPAGVEPITHLNRLGAHWAYGAGTALATQTLLRLF